MSARCFRQNAAGVESGGGLGVFQVRWILFGDLVNAVAGFVLRRLDLESVLFADDGNEAANAMGLPASLPSSAPGASASPASSA
jgi:hypothetical protein